MTALNENEKNAIFRAGVRFGVLNTLAALVKVAMDRAARG